MTTIAWDGETIACDSLVTQNDMVYDHHNKIHKTKGGGVVLSAGPINISPDFVKWFNGEIEGPEYPTDTAFRVLYLDPSKKLWIYWNSAKICSQALKRGAIGTGEPHAVTALDLGYSAEDAVKAAIKRDIYSGGKIRLVRYK